MLMMKMLVSFLFFLGYVESSSSSSFHSLTSSSSISHTSSFHPLTSIISSISKSSFHPLSSSSFVPPNNSLAYFVEMGVFAGTPSIIKNGKSDPNVLSLDGRWVTTNFYLWLNGNAPTTKLPFHVLSNNFRDSKSYMDTLWSKTHDFIKPHRGGSLLDTQIQVTYNCKDLGEESHRVRLQMTLGFNGSYDNITFRWRKTCGPIESDGWSSAGIFAFTVFILLLVFCGVGCVYNYVQQNRTGCDVIPGITIWRECFNKCFNKGPRYSPQMDYENPGNDDGEYGVSYQTNL